MTKIHKRDDYNSGNKCTWCPGCGNFTIWYMLKQAFLELGLQPHEMVIVYDIGCNGNGSNFNEIYGFHGLHGRALPVAQGIKLANNKLKVIVIGGDGGGMGLGAGHFIHACRRNIDITYILHDNQIYGLTTGQTSPRSDKGMITKTSPGPKGNLEEPVNPLSIALTSHATHISRGFSGSPHHLKNTLKEAIMHKGFSFVDVLQPCITFNKLNTYAWYNERTYDLTEESKYDPTNRIHAWEKCEEFGDKIPLGLIYKEEKPTYEDELDIDLDVLSLESFEPINIDPILHHHKV